MYRIILIVIVISAFLGSSALQLAGSSEAGDTVLFSCSEPTATIKASILQKSFGELGKIWVVRNAGNVVSLASARPDCVELATVEHAVWSGATRVIVLGHKDCGIVREVMVNPRGMGNEPAIFQVISASLTRSKRALTVEGGTQDEILRKTVELNVMNTASSIADDRFPGSPDGSSSLRDLVESGKLEVIGAVYDPDAGSIEIVK